MQISKLFYPVAQALMMTILLTGVAIAGQTHKSVPTVFQGEWIEDLSKCGSVDDTKLKIAGKHIYFYESHALSWRMVAVGIVSD